MRSKIIQLILLSLFVVSIASIAVAQTGPWEDVDFGEQEKSIAYADPSYNYKVFYIYTERSLQSKKLATLKKDTPITVTGASRRENSHPKFKDSYEYWFKVSKPVKGWMFGETVGLCYSDFLFYAFGGDDSEWGEEVEE